MSNPKDSETAKLTAQVARLEKIVQFLDARVSMLEKQNKRLRSAVSRASDHVGTLERRLPRK